MRTRAHPVRGEGRSHLELDHHLDFEGRLVADDPAAREADAGHATEVVMHEQIPHRADLDYYRKHAKALVRAHRQGDPEARARAARALGDRDRFLLADALHVIAREHGLRSWPELKRAVEASRAERGLAGLPDGGEALTPFDLAYVDGEPVRVRVRRRAHRIDIDDRGEGVERAGRPPGWLPVAQAVVERHNLNVNRRGVVFVPAVTGRDIESLARRVAEASYAVHAALVELGS